MRWSITRLITISAVVAALGLGASQAHAQKVSFHLPFEAHWGSTVLNPGSYTLITPDPQSFIRIFYLHGDAGTKMAVPTIVNHNEAHSGRSYLKLVKVDGTYYVREYVSAINHTALEFHVPKGTHRELRAEDRVLMASDF